MPSAGVRELRFRELWDKRGASTEDEGETPMADNKIIPVRADLEAGGEAEPGRSGNDKIMIGGVTGSQDEGFALVAGGN